MKRVKVFVDSDVVISSLISSKGAAYFLLREKNFDRFISDISKKEIETVAKRLELAEDSLKKLYGYLKVVTMQKSLQRIKKDFGNYTLDQNDAHIVAGAKKAKAAFHRKFALETMKEVRERNGLF